MSFLESWFTVRGHDGRYLVSSTGYLQDVWTGGDVHEKNTPNGERWARLRDEEGRHWVKVSRTVFTTINGPIPAGWFVNYRDGNRKNCSISNLYLSESAPGQLLRSGRTECVKFSHPLTSWNTAPDGRCRACKAAHGSTRTPDEEFARLYEKHYGVPYVDDRAEYFDRSGIGVWDIYSGL